MLFALAPMAGLVATAQPQNDALFTIEDAVADQAAAGLVNQPENPVVGAPDITSLMITADTDQVLRFKILVADFETKDRINLNLDFGASFSEARWAGRWAFYHPSFPVGTAAGVARLNGFFCIVLPDSPAPDETRYMQPPAGCIVQDACAAVDMDGGAFHIVIPKLSLLGRAPAHEAFAATLPPTLPESASLDGISASLVSANHAQWTDRVPESGVQVPAYAIDPALDGQWLVVTSPAGGGREFVQPAGASSTVPMAYVPVLRVAVSAGAPEPMLLMVHNVAPSAR